MSDSRPPQGPRRDWSNLPEQYAQRRAAGYTIVVLSSVVGLAWTLVFGGHFWTHVFYVAIFPLTWYAAWKLAKAVRASGMF